MRIPENPSPSQPGRLSPFIVMSGCLLSCLFPHAAAVAVMFGKVNASISEYLAAFPEYAPVSGRNILIPLTHCAVALNFYMAMTLFLMLLFRDAVIPIVLIMAWCALEAGPLNIIFQRYDMFAGAFGPQDFTAIFPQTSCGC